MDSEVFVIVVLAIIAATLICCLPIVLAFMAATRKKRNRAESGDEEERLRRIWEGLQKMEARLDNIETIVGKGRRGGSRETSGSTRYTNDY